MIPGITRRGHALLAQVVEELEPHARLRRRTARRRSRRARASRPDGGGRSRGRSTRDDLRDAPRHRRRSRRRSRTRSMRSVACASSPGGRFEVLRRIAAQAPGCSRMPGVVVARHDLGQLVARVRRAREVRHRGERRLAVDARDDVVRHLARRAARAVGDRHERRVQRLEVADGLLELQLGRGRLRREELERVARPRREDVDDLAHRRYKATEPAGRRFRAFRHSASRQPSEQNHTSAPSCTRCAGAFAFSTCMPHVGSVA